MAHVQVQVRGHFSQKIKHEVLTHSISHWMDRNLSQSRMLLRKFPPRIWGTLGGLRIMPPKIPPSKKTRQANRSNHANVSLSKPTEIFIKFLVRAIPGSTNGPEVSISTKMQAQTQKAGSQALQTRPQEVVTTKIAIVISAPHQQHQV